MKSSPYRGIHHEPRMSILSLYAVGRCHGCIPVAVGAAFGALAGASDAYGYNTRSEVTSARRTLGADPVGGFAFDYAYDPIGNRTSATEYDESGAPLPSAYAANALNQYTQRTVPGYAAVRGEADTNAFVTVNERPVARTAPARRILPPPLRHTDRLSPKRIGRQGVFSRRDKR